MNTFVYYHSALLAHFPPNDRKIAEELRGAPRESPYNRDFEETVNLIVLRLVWLLVCYLYKEVIYKFLNVCPFDYTAVAGSGTVGP